MSSGLILQLITRGTKHASQLKDNKYLLALIGAYGPWGRNVHFSRNLSKMWEMEAFLSNVTEMRMQTTWKSAWNKAAMPILNTFEPFMLSLKYWL